MQTQKMSLANIKGKLSRLEMKNIMAGSGSGTCCAHSADWTYQSCNINMATAQQRASQYAQGGHPGYWCCSSC